jgi:hypothetical protein
MGAITEDFVKTSVYAWLIAKGYTDVQMHLGTRPGDDVRGKSPDSGKKLWVECKGATVAANQWDRAWRNLSDAFFKAIDKSEKTPTDDDIAIAIPDTKDYRDRMAHLEQLCRRQNWKILSVSEAGHVQPWF